MIGYPPLPHKLRTSIRDLQRARYRDATRTFVVEGVRACEALLGSALVPDVVVVGRDADPRAMQAASAFALMGVDVLQALPRELELMCDASTPQELLAVVPFPSSRPLGDRIVVLDGVRDPGNAGTIIRTAAWFGFTDAVVLEGSVDPFHPKVVRSTAGVIARMNILRDATTETWTSAWNARGPIVATVVHGGTPPADVSVHDAVAILIGSEADGLSAASIAAASQLVTIPGTAGVESLNAAIAAGILCYEFRTRG